MNFKNIFPLLIIIGLMACNDNSKPVSKNSSSVIRTSSIKSDSIHISEEFKWDITNIEKADPYFGSYSTIKFNYQGKKYVMDTLYSRVSPCNFLDTTIGEPCVSLKGSGVVGAYFGANAGIFCYGQVTDIGDSLQYRYWCDSEDDEEQISDVIVRTFKKQSFGKAENSETDNYVMHYISQDEACDLKISVEKRGVEYKYQLISETLKNSGILKIDTVENNVYFLFKNLNSESEGYSIEAQVNDEGLMIQNYGNAMNQYKHFENCDVKYIHLIKE